MKTGATIYVFDPERRSREPDAQPERDPSGATVVVLQTFGAKRAAYKRLRDRLRYGPPLMFPPSEWFNSAL